MSGAEFEHYMAKVYEALGYNVTVLGGAGDRELTSYCEKGPNMWRSSVRITNAL
jgi:hypothetical protein